MGAGRFTRVGRAPPILFLAGLLCGAPFPAIARPQPALDGAAANLTRYWAHGSADLIAELLVASDIRLQVANEDHFSLSQRQAVAVLRGYLERHRTESIRVEQATEVGGSPLLGYAELHWHVVHEGGSQSFQHTIYVGFVREDEAWRVFEIRVLQ